MDLSELPVNGGVRQRGEQVTRLETFVDAAFAFAVTLLVVSFDAMPSSFAELYDALRRLPAFLAGFAILALFWHGHHRFSRNFGLEDGTIVFLSLALVAATRPGDAAAPDVVREYVVWGAGLRASQKSKQIFKLHK